MNSITTLIHFEYKKEQLPVIYLLDENKIPLLPLYYGIYLREHKALSYQKIYKAMKSISLLYDYHRVHLKNKELTEYETKTLITGFIFERSKGDILNWNKVNKETVNQEFYQLRDFSKWCSNNYNILDFGYQENSFKNVIKESFKDYMDKNTKLLYHLKKSKFNGMKPFSNFRKKVPKAFPYDKIKELIDKTPSSRDKMILLLLAFGGKRISEICHLFVQDIVVKNKKVNIRIAHPEYSFFEWYSNGKDKRGTRSDYLKDSFDRVPRNCMPKTREFVGWKGMCFDDESIKISQVYFISDIQEILYKLHLDYFHNIRKKFNHHPYYFIKKNGEPLSVRGMIKVFHRACERIGLKEFSSITGITPHGLRHFYGFYCVDILDLDLKLVQKYMGHTSITSTEIYASVSRHTASEKLLKAKELQGKIDFKES